MLYMYMSVTYLQVQIYNKPFKYSIRLPGKVLLQITRNEDKDVRSYLGQTGYFNTFSFSCCP